MPDCCKEVEKGCTSLTSVLHQCMSVHFLLRDRVPYLVADLETERRKLIHSVPLRKKYKSHRKINRIINVWWDSPLKAWLYYFKKHFLPLVIKCMIYQKKRQKSAYLGSPILESCSLRDSWQELGNLHLSVKIPETKKSVKNQLTTPCFWPLSPHIYHAQCILLGIFFKLRDFLKFQEKTKVFCRKKKNQLQ